MTPLIDFKGCNTCGLKKEWPNLIHPRMPIAQPFEKSPYRIVVHGEAPGKTEDEYGRPFLGDAGTYLRKAIPQKWERKLYWTNSVRCRPPKNRTPEDAEIQCCSIFQIEDFEKLKPQAILALGDIALKYYWDEAWITGMRGIPFPARLPSGHTFWVMSTFHPSYVMRQDKKNFRTGEVTNTMLPVFKSDLLYFFENIEEFTSNPPQIASLPEEIHYPKTKQEALNLYKQLSEPHGFDVETFKLRYYMQDARCLTAAFSDGKITFAFPVEWPGASYAWGREALKEMLLMKRHWICQSGSMEYSWAWGITGTHDHHIEDTEALARLIHKRKGVGKLDFLSRLYLGINVKQIGGVDALNPAHDKLNLLRHPLEEVLKYNALDAWSEFKVFEALVPRASADDLENYVRIVDAIKSTTAMEVKGLEVDLKASDELKKQYYGEMQVFENQAREIPQVREYERKYQTIFRLSEPQTVGNVLVDFCGIPLPKTEKEKQYSTLEADLQPFLKECPLVKVVLDYRDVAKLISTYVDPFLNGVLFGVDGRIHPQYTVVHTATYRLSSENPNIQNFPKRAHKEARRQIRAKAGHVFAAFDYGQLEGRVIAMFSKDRNLIKSFVTDEDIHWKWLYRIIDLYPEYMDRLARISGEKDEKKVLKAGRTIIKTDFVFSSFYGSQPEAIANKTEIPLSITEQVQGEFWSEYCDAKKWVDGQFKLYQEKGYVTSLTNRIRNEVLPGNETCNSPAQGSAAELVLEAQNALFYKAIETGDWYYQPRINIHDDLMFELPDDDRLGDYVDEIQKEIVKPRFPFVNVPLVTECRVGPDWASLESIFTFKGPYFENNTLVATV